MSVPATRDEFKEYCLRALGKPVIRINVDDTQVEDRIDEALKYYADYHFDATEKIFYKYRLDANNKPYRLNSVQVVAGGNSYSNSDTITFTHVQGSGAAATLTTDANGSIVTVTVTAVGDSYATAPDVTVNTTTGTGADLRAILGGFVPVPENVIGAVNVFPIAGAIGTNFMWDARYQLVLNDLWMYTSIELLPFFMAMSHLQQVEMMLVGQQPIRFNRHTNRLYIDANWRAIADDLWVVVEAYQVVDPALYSNVWGDRWLMRYATALIKKNWGSNLKKFGAMAMPGGTVFNGQIIYDEAVTELTKLEDEMISSYSLPVSDMIG